MTDTPDAAKLLPCPFCGELPVTDNVGENGRALMIECETEHCGVQPHVSCYDHRAARKWWNTRPQLAPPEGEPDFQEIAREIAGLCGKHCAPYPGFTYHPVYVADTVMRPLMTLLRDRLGLAARPKVEDAALVLWKKQYGAVASDPTLSEDEARTLLTKAYDLLERVAGERDQAIATMQWIDGENSIAMKRANAADSKLAEREAELADMDWLYALHARSKTPSIDESDRAVKIIDAHAARQQQKS